MTRDAALRARDARLRADRGGGARHARRADGDLIGSEAWRRRFGDLDTGTAEYVCQRHWSGVPIGMRVVSTRVRRRERRFAARLPAAARIWRCIVRELGMGDGTTMTEGARVTMDGATMTLDIPWQGVHLRRPKDDSSDDWSTITTSRGIFVVQSRGGKFSATPKGDGNPGPDINTADYTDHGIILGAQAVTLTRINGRWTGHADLSGRDLAIEDPRP